MSFRQTKSHWPGKQKDGKSSSDSWRNPLVHFPATGQASPSTGAYKGRGNRSTKRDYRCTSNTHDTESADRGDFDAGGWDAYSVCAEFRSYFASSTGPDRFCAGEVAESAMARGSAGVADELRFRGRIIQLFRDGIILWFKIITSELSGRFWGCRQPR